MSYSNDATICLPWLYGTRDKFSSLYLTPAHQPLVFVEVESCAADVRIVQSSVHSARLLGLLTSFSNLFPIFR